MFWDYPLDSLTRLSYGRRMTRSAGRPRIEVRQEPPTDQERRGGLVFECPGCDREWSLRFKHPREQLCLSCGRDLGRERKRAQRARARDEEVTAPPRAPQHTKTEPIAGKKVQIADFVESAEPQQLTEVDRVILRATRQKRPKSGGGLVK